MDDDPVGRTLVRLLLERAGYWVEETDDAKMALEMALMEGPDVALIAARIGRHSGLALSWCIRRGGGPPVILMRARVDIVPDRLRARAGLSGMLTKPVTPEGLAERLGAILERRGQVAASPPPASSSAPPSVPSSPQRGPAVLDLAVLDEHLTLLGAERVAQIIDSFTRNAPATLDQIDQALQDGDVPALGRAAHKLASGALTVGLPALATLAKAADTAAKRQDGAAARDHAGQIRSAFTAGMAGLAAFRRDRLSR
ncbi:response regulator [Niveispirillum fermenti]|uniref:response regulator n=1 Tax=Niveispirillum fermenti TaxID=1233113 RepID=UPI0040413773